jgi:hypothetical protein
VKRHSRKISNSLSKSGGYQHVDGKYEMRALMDPSETRVVSPILGGGKVSGESFSVGGSEFEDADGGMVVKI